MAPSKEEGEDEEEENYIMGVKEETAEGIDEILEMELQVRLTCLSVIFFPCLCGLICLFSDRFRVTYEFMSNIREAVLKYDPLC